MRFKKFLAALLAVALLISVAPVYGVQAETAPQLVIGSGEVDVKNGANTVRLPVELKNNPGISGFKVKIAIPAGWEILPDNEEEPGFAGSGIEYAVETGVNEDGDPVYECGVLAKLHKRGYPLLNVDYAVANPAAGTVVVANDENVEGDGVLFWVTFKVPAKSINDKYGITLAVETLGNSASVDFSESTTVVAGTVVVTGGTDMLTDTNTVVTLEKNSYEYTGSAIEPKVTSVKYGDATLTAGTDYTVSYTNNVNIGEATVTVTGTGSYQGTATATFQITKAQQTVSVEDVTKTYSADTFALNATAKTTVTYAVKEGSEGVVSVSGNTVTMLKAGDATIIATAEETDEYASASAEINVKINKATITYTDGLTVASKSYDGTVTAATGGTAVFTGKVGSDDVTVTVTEAKFKDADVGENKPVTATIALSGAQKDNYVLANDEVELTGTITQADALTGLTAEKPVMYSSTGKVSFGADDIAAISEASKAKDIVVTDFELVEGGHGNVENVAVEEGKLTFNLKSGLASTDKNETDKINVTFTSKNYKASTVELTVKVIDKIDVTEQIKFENGSATYNGEVQTYKAATCDLGAVTYTYSSEMKDVGTYKVTATYEDEKNFGQKTVDFVINAAELTVEGATVADKDYDTTGSASITAVTFVGLQGEDKLTASDYTVSNAAFAGEDFSAGINKDVTFDVVLNDTVKNYVLKTGEGVAEKTTGTINKLSVDASIAAIDAVTYTGSAHTPEPVVTIETLNSEAASYSVEYANNTEAGDNAAVIVKSTDKNYAFEATKTFVINKADATVSVTAVKKNYDGNEFKGTDVTYEASFNDAPITGTWNVTKVAGSDDYDAGNYTVDLVFKPANNSLNEKTFENVAAEIMQATVKFEVPEVKDSNTMLGDLEIAFTGVDGTELEGTVTWVDKDGKTIEKPEETKIEANTKYTFKFEPTDDNYADLVAEITPYEVSTGIESNINIKSGSTKHGSVSINPLDAEKGDKVVVTVKPKTGYEVDEVTVTTSKGKDVAVKSAGSNKYVFVMPAGQVTLEVTYKKADVVKFLDVADNAWYHDSVYAAVDMGLFTGVSDNYFQPDGSMTRAMLVTVLWRLEGSPAAGSADFADVANGSWYDKAVAWANKEGIVTGISDASFAPNAAITREQMATMLYRYAKYLGLNTAAKADLSDYADADKISAYAVDAMAWAVRAGLINGVTADTLAPAGTATRAQVATILVRFVEKFL